MVIKLPPNTNLNELFTKLDVESVGKKIMLKKSKIELFLIKNIKTPAANILKQDALSIGAEFAVPSGVITCSTTYVDGVLMCTQKQLEILIKKESIQPFGLKNIFIELKQYQNLRKDPIEIMGILNINSDSFYSNSRLDSNECVSRSLEMIEDGADILDFGAVSSRPGSDEVCEDEEFLRAKPIIDLLYKEKIYQKTKLSLDSFRPNVINYALDHGFSIINDITGLENDEVAKLCAKYEAKTIIMHMQKKPKNMQDEPYYKNVVLDIKDFFRQRVEKAHSFGIKNCVLDVGIGFGKTLKHNLDLINHQEDFLSLGCQILIGASRKSMIDKIIPSQIKDRLPATLILHFKAIENGASIIRCHDVKEHFQALKIYEALNK